MSVKDVIAQNAAGGAEEGVNECLPRVIEVTRAVALEFGGARARQAVTPDASLVREVGLGSLEQMELRLRLEAAFGVELADDTLALDTPGELARAVGEARAAEPTPLPSGQASATGPSA